MQRRATSSTGVSRKGGRQKSGRGEETVGEAHFGRRTMVCMVIRRGEETQRRERKGGADRVGGGKGHGSQKRVW